MKYAALRGCAIAMTMGLAACGMHAAPLAQTPQSSIRYLKPQDTYGGITGSKLNVLLGDAAPNLGGHKLKHLDLGILEIDGISNGQATVLASYDEPRIVDVLAHDDDNGENVANANVSRTQYQQLRLVVDIASSRAKFEGSPKTPIDFLVNVASASSVGAGVTTVTTTDGPGAVDIVVTQPFSIPADGHAVARVDFNAFESLALDQTGALLARPALFVAPIDQMGRVTGTIVNASGGDVDNATVIAVATDGSIGNTGFTDHKGRFSIGTLRAGSYTLMIYNAYTNAAGWQTSASGASSTAQTITGPTVTITAGHHTSAGSITD